MSKTAFVVTSERIAGVPRVEAVVVAATLRSAIEKVEKWSHSDLGRDWEIVNEDRARCKDPAKPFAFLWMQGTPLIS